MNKIYLTVIPKKDNTNSVCASQYRSISLCNVSYEIIFKLLAKRLRIILVKIISPLENAFVPNKDIHDNILSMKS